MILDFNILIVKRKLRKVHTMTNWQIKICNKLMNLNKMILLKEKDLIKIDDYEIINNIK